MTTTQDQIRSWLEEGRSRGATHVLVVCDTFDYEDYPVYVQTGEDAKEIAQERYGWPGSKDMQRVMECYDLRLPLGAQLAAPRAFYW